MNTYHEAVMKTAWRRIKKPRKGSLVTIQGRACIITRSKLNVANKAFPELSITARVI